MSSLFPDWLSEVTFSIESSLSTSWVSLAAMVSDILSCFVQRRVASSYEVMSASKSFFLMSVSRSPDIRAESETSSRSSIFWKAFAASASIRTMKSGIFSPSFCWIVLKEDRSILVSVAGNNAFSYAAMSKVASHFC